MRARSGKDGDIVAKSPSAIAADPDAQGFASRVRRWSAPGDPALAW